MSTDASGGAADDNVPIVCTAGREEITARNFVLGQLVALFAGDEPLAAIRGLL